MYRGNDYESRILERNERGLRMQVYVMVALFLSLLLYLIF
jgi:hypothetical protein